MIGVKERDNNRGRRVDGEGDEGRSDDIGNRVRGIRLGGIKERSQRATVVGLKQVDEDDEDGKDVIDVHGGSVAVCGRMSSKVVGEGEDAESREVGWQGLYTRP